MNALTIYAPNPKNPWTQLRTELRDLAFVLDRQGNPVAADVASTIAARIDELLTDETQTAAHLERALLN